MLDSKGRSDMNARIEASTYAQVRTVNERLARSQPMHGRQEQRKHGTNVRKHGTNVRPRLKRGRLLACGHLGIYGCTYFFFVAWDRFMRHLEIRMHSVRLQASLERLVYSMTTRHERASTLANSCDHQFSLRIFFSSVDHINWS